SMSTVHANDTRDALDRLELMIALSGADLPNSIARRYIASAIHLLVHITRLPNGERKVMRISELIGFQNGEYMVEDLFVFRITGVEKNGQVHGAFYATGHHPVAMNWLTQTNFDDCEDLFHARELKLSDTKSDQQDGQEQ
ncbi:MAG TPA: pilus assembly protein CpaF, partial [Planctomycetaceae bacterium]|nr:pilus assembly protein CpaF [Planctomycetaceae bacterium]